MADELHGDLTQAQRKRVLEDFKKAKLQILVATDLATRGLDIEGLTHVYNYDLPIDAESYIHRIGRTGRGGAEGVSVTLATLKDYDKLRKIEAAIKNKLVKVREQESRQRIKHRDNEKKRIANEKMAREHDEKKSFKQRKVVKQSIIKNKKSRLKNKTKRK